ncbi:MAG: hypothetical protein QG670_2661, partial [Thermoproteota archaeon]|nr:hypothetical protein [Thermoproteota archaeon]
MEQRVKLSRDLGFLRVGGSVPDVRVADVKSNVDSIIHSMKKAENSGTQVIAFPEMAITGYSVQDLVLQDTLLFRAREGLDRILLESRKGPMLVAVGMPLEVNGRIFNCAVVLNSGQILGVIPKSFLPNYKEYYEDRWFTSSSRANSNMIEINGQQVPFGTDILFELQGMANAIVGVEICEDLWVPLSPHEYQARAGATVLLNLSASNEIIGKSDWRRSVVTSESGRCIAAYCYVSAGIGESSNDLVFGGHMLIAENGTVLEESDRLTSKHELVISDIDIDRLANDRRVTTTFHSSAKETQFRIVKTDINDVSIDELKRSLDAHPFVPKDSLRRAERCRDIFAMQVAALAKKLSSLTKKQVLLVVSGGLDSTLALLVAVKTINFLGLQTTNVYAYN